MSSDDTKSVNFSEVPNGSIFKALTLAELPGYPMLREKVWPGERTVSNSGTFKKIAQSHSVEIHSGKDAIFLPTMPCRVIKYPHRHAPKAKPNKRSFGERLSKLGRVTVIKKA